MLVLYPNCCFASFHDKKTKLLHKKTFLELLMFCCPLKNWTCWFLLGIISPHIVFFGVSECKASPSMRILRDSSPTLRHPWGSPSFTPPTTPMADILGSWRNSPLWKSIGNSHLGRSKGCLPASSQNSCNPQGLKPCYFDTTRTTHHFRTTTEPIVILYRIHGTNGIVYLHEC